MEPVILNRVPFVCDTILLLKFCTRPKICPYERRIGNALKIAIPSYQSQTQAADPAPDFSNIVITGGTVVYLNPDFPTVVIKFGGY